MFVLCEENIVVAIYYNNKGELLYINLDPSVFCHAFKLLRQMTLG